MNGQQYACDFETVQSIANKISDISDNMATVVGNYDSNMEGLWNNWDGASKESFRKSYNTIIEDLKSEITKISEFSQYIKDAKEAINDVETILSSTRI